jgi:hypothetical protein
MPAGLDAAVAARLEREALRVYARYQLEIVEGLSLCPWARRARLEGRVRQRVLLLRSADPTPVVASIAELAADPTIDIGLLLFPRLELDADGFERFVAAARLADEAGRPLGGVPFAMACFHPDAAPDLADPERLIPFLRRTPDPTVQLVRRSVLDEVRASAPHGTCFVDELQLGAVPLEPAELPPLRERIARSNLETLRRVGLDEVSALLDQIRADRDRAYARILQRA